MPHPPGSRWLAAALAVVVVLLVAASPATGAGATGVHPPGAAGPHPPGAHLPGAAGPHPPGAHLPGAARQSEPGDGKAAGIRWAVQPSGQDGPTGRSWFTYDLAPGTEIVDWVGITNLSDSDLDFTIYPTDAYTTADGGFALLPHGDLPRDLGAWITMEVGEHRVPAGHRLDIPFRLTVPDNATPGDHAGGVIAALTARSSSADGTQVELDQRVAARVYLRVDGPARPAVEVESVRVSYANPLLPWGSHTMTVTYALRNTGNLRLTGASGVRVAGSFGWAEQATEPVDIPELLPGSSLMVTETITGVPPLVRLTAAVNVDGVTTEGELPRVTRTAGVWAVPWLLLALIVVTVGALWLRRRIRRRRLVAAGPARSDDGAPSRSGDR